MNGLVNGNRSQFIVEELNYNKFNEIPTSKLKQTHRSNYENNIHSLLSTNILY